MAFRRERSTGVSRLACIALLSAGCRSGEIAAAHDGGIADAARGATTGAGGTSGAGAAGALSTGASSGRTAASGSAGEGAAPSPGGAPTMGSGGAPGSGAAGNAGTTGSAGTAGSGGTASSSGTAGSAGTTGSSGTAGSGGTTGSAGTASSGGTTGVAEVRVVGRTDGSAGAPRFEWSSVSIQARFKGTSVVADIDGGDNDYFEVVVDGEIKPTIATTSGRKKVPIVSGLPDAEHQLVLWRRAEANNYAVTQFFGLDFGGGTLLPIIVPPHKLEIIGDSLTCGYGNEGDGPDCSFSYDTENSYLAYGAVAARALDADLYTECWSGKGMYRNGGGDMNEPIPVLFQRAIATDPKSTWDFSWTPDAVVINLGTNDFAQGDPGQPFVNAYEAFVSDLRKHYPSAYIFLIDGPAMSGRPLTTARGYLDQVVQARKDQGDTRIEQILVAPQDQSKNGIGCDYHPSVATDAIMGAALAASIKKTMGW